MVISLRGIALLVLFRNRLYLYTTHDTNIGLKLRLGTEDKKNLVINGSVRRIKSDQGRTGRLY